MFENELHSEKLKFISNIFDKIWFLFYKSSSNIYKYNKRGFGVEKNNQYLSA